MIISEETRSKIINGDYMRFIKYALRHMRKLKITEVDNGLERGPGGS